jgi:hypothetical protein
MAVSALLHNPSSIMQLSAGHKERMITRIRMVVVVERTLGSGAMSGTWALLFKYSISVVDI